MLFTNKITPTLHIRTFVHMHTSAYIRITSHVQIHITALAFDRGNNTINTFNQKFSIYICVQTNPLVVGTHLC